jgi:hypothetical protein
VNIQHFKVEEAVVNMLKQSMVGIITILMKSPTCAFRCLQAQKRSQKGLKQFLAVLQIMTLLDRFPSGFKAAAAAANLANNRTFQLAER